MLTYYRVANLVIVISLCLLFISCKENTIQPELFGSISGSVLDQETSQPLADASVTTAPPSSAIVTNSAGKFNFSNLPVGNYTVTVSKSGYKKATVSVSVKEDITTDAVIFMEKDEENNSPNVPTNPNPPNESEDQPVSITLKWSASDQDKDSLTYDVYLYKSNSPSPVQVASDYTDTTFLVENLEYNTTYFWQIIVKDTANATVNGNIWTFKTKNFPDNNIVFTSKVNGNYEIYSVSEADTQSIKLTSRSSRELWPRFNPNRSKIAFSSDESVQPQIFIMNNDGSDLYQVTALPIAGYHNFGIGFTWSHDGGRILYSNYDKLSSINQDGSNLFVLANAPSERNFREIDFSPLGNRIVVLTIGLNIYDSEIYLMNNDGSNFTLLFSNLPGVIESPSFAPDGNRIVFTRDISGHEVANGRQLNAHIFIMNIDGSDTIDISQNKPDGTNDLHPRFSPDGSKIIFENVLNDGSSSKEIWIMDTTGNNRKRLNINGEMPDWR
jgi:TolB protein